MDKELSKVIIVYLIIVALAVIFTLEGVKAEVQAHGVSLLTDAGLNDGMGGCSVRSSSANWRLNNITVRGSDNPTNCYVYPNSTSLSYGSPLATGTFSGLTCQIEFNATANVTYILAVDHPSGTYQSFYQNPAGSMPGIQNTIISWWAGLFSNGAKTSWSIYPTALVDITQIDVTDLTPAPNPPIIDSWSITPLSNVSLLHQWSVSGIVNQVNLTRSGVVIYSTTDPDFFNLTLEDTNLTPCTFYSYSLTAYRTYDEYDRLNSTVRTNCNEPSPDSSKGISDAIDRTTYFWLFLGCLFAEICFMFLSVYARGLGHFFSGIGLLLAFLDFVFFLQIRDLVPLLVENFIFNWGSIIGFLIVIPLCFFTVFLLQLFMIRRNVYKYI